MNFELWFIIIILIIADNPLIIRNQALVPVHLSSGELPTVGSLENLIFNFHY